MAIIRSLKKIEQLEKQVKEDFGEKCRDFEFGCATCRVHLAIAILKDVYVFEETR